MYLIESTHAAESPCGRKTGCSACGAVYAVGEERHYVAECLAHVIVVQHDLCGACAADVASAGTHVALSFEDACGIASAHHGSPERSGRVMARITRETDMRERSRVSAIMMRAERAGR